MHLKQFVQATRAEKAILTRTDLTIPVQPATRKKLKTTSETQAAQQLIKFLSDPNKSARSLLLSKKLLIQGCLQSQMSKRLLNSCIQNFYSKQSKIRDLLEILQAKMEQNWQGVLLICRCLDVKFDGFQLNNRLKQLAAYLQDSVEIGIFWKYMVLFQKMIELEWAKNYLNTFIITILHQQLVPPSFRPKFQSFLLITSSRPVQVKEAQTPRAVLPQHHSEGECQGLDRWAAKQMIR